MKYSAPLFLLAALLFTLQPARAEIKIVPGGTPEQPVMETNPEGEYYNIYERQLSYVETDKQFRKEMIARSKVYAAPSIKSQQDHRKNLKALYGFKEETEHEESTQESIDEPFGPPSESAGSPESANP